MIVPDYWAEARKQHREKNKQVTVRRFGGATLNQAEAEAMAESRVADALMRILSGEKLPRQENKTAYNGAFGVPIREEVLFRQGEEVITRNSYGAHCLNTPRVLFADVDFALERSGRVALVTCALLTAVAGVAGLHYGRWPLVIVLLLISFSVVPPVIARLARTSQAAREKAERSARERVEQFVKQHSEWNLKIYETPAGLRLLATHRPFDPAEAEVKQFFEAVGTDPVYVQMCTNQKCFRARLTAKPWRIGISQHMRPRPGTWPVHPDRLPFRQQWVEHYEKVAAGFAACRFTESLGSGLIHDDLRGVVELHDRESRANESGLTMA